MAIMGKRMHQPTGEGQPDVFISYSHKDAEWVKKLVDSLGKEVIGSRNLIVGIDEQFANGKSLIDSIEKAVRDSKFLICVLSPDYVNSDWTALEYQMKILDDPSGKKGIIIPILYRECEIPYTLLIRLCADFRKPENFKRAYHRLCLALNVGKKGGVSSSLSEHQAHYETTVGPSVIVNRHEPDPIVENLAINFFDLVRKPKYLWYADTEYRFAKDLLIDSKRSVDECFSLSGGKIWSFSQLKTSNLAFAMNGEQGKIAFDEALLDPRRNTIIELLNRLLWMRIKETGLIWDRKRERCFFPPIEYGKTRLVPWPALKRSSERTVVYPKFRLGEVDGYVHIAASIKFVTLGKKVGLQILPTRLITTDGTKTKGGPTVGPVVVKMLKGVHNNQFWLEVMFWLYQLHNNGKILISNPNEEEIVVDEKPIMTTLNAGIIGDSYPFLSSDYADRWKEWDTLEQEVNDSESYATLPGVNGE
jgi:hypothetical protein